MFKERERDGSGGNSSRESSNSSYTLERDTVNVRVSSRRSTGRTLVGGTAGGCNLFANLPVCYICVRANPKNGSTLTFVSMNPIRIRSYD